MTKREFICKYAPRFPLNAELVKFMHDLDVMLETAMQLYRR